jgi:hypothetical protein
MSRLVRLWPGPLYVHAGEVLTRTAIRRAGPSSDLTKSGAPSGAHFGGLVIAQ